MDDDQKVDVNSLWWDVEKAMTRATIAFDNPAATAVTYAEALEGLTSALVPLVDWIRATGGNDLPDALKNADTEPPF